MNEQPTTITIQWREALIFGLTGLGISLTFWLTGTRWDEDPQSSQTYAGMLTTVLLCAGLWVSFRAKTQKVPPPIFAAMILPGPFSLTLALPIQNQVVYHLLSWAGLLMILAIQRKAAHQPSA
ncbi:hypothetical protein [Acanthopleuribacter pedis]|uniref:Transmembrane protein n=1 Tax=Acanthopleuribacter pedis TaxID=442870 RepID=A0A8J7QAG5_9BACT|nr:hypothetical protein [Acanthopleuribacter pedis]MBO1317186.1 hypothetical protein [Acanthopleuribacter pedis]